MTRIRAAVCHAFGAPLRLEEIVLRPPGAGEIEVTLEAVAICHSDIHYMDGAWGGDLPAVYGHEAAGRISKIGPGVRGLEPGSRVIVTLMRSCGACPECGGGRPIHCRGNGPVAPALALADGTPVTKAMNCGAFAERVVVEQSQVVAIPEDAGADMPPELACLLACGVPTGLGAVVNTARVRPGDAVVVIGAGGVGLNAVQGAYIAGAARIIAIDRVQDKLDGARAFGATHGILADAPAPWKAVRALTGGRGADHVFVTVGAIPAYDLAPRLLAPSGMAIAVGMPHSGDMAQYEPVLFAATGTGMRGSMLGDVVLRRDIPWMIDLHAQGRLKLAELVSARYPFEAINEAIADARAGAARRNVIVF